MYFSNDINEGYSDTRDSLAPIFPEAYEFLNWIENLHDKGFHVGTAINLHLYLEDKFLFYFRKDSPTQVTISSKPNVHIKQGTHIDNKSFFILWLDLMKKMNLDKGRDIKIIQKTDITVTITKSIESPKLFEVLKKALKFISHKS